MTTGVGKQTRRRGRVITEVIAPLGRHVLADDTRGGNADDALHAWPGVLLLQPRDLRRDIPPADFDPAMPLVNVFVGLERSA